MSIDAAAMVEQYGLLAVFAFVGLEAMGLPLPGETVLVLAAVAAGSGTQLQIWHVLVTAIVAAIVGDNAGYLLGRFGGWPLMRRYGRIVRVGQSSMKVGRYLFARHGAIVVFGGRFIAVLRTLAAFLAGVNHMPWRRFLMFNAAGGAVWASIWSGLSYAFGTQIEQLPTGARIVVAGLAITAAVVGGLTLKRRWHRLEDVAERAYPGPLV